MFKICKASSEVLLHIDTSSWSMLEMISTVSRDIFSTSLMVLLTHKCKSKTLLLTWPREPSTSQNTPTILNGSSISSTQRVLPKHATVEWIMLQPSVPKSPKKHKQSPYKWILSSLVSRPVLRLILMLGTAMLCTQDHNQSILDNQNG